MIYFALNRVAIRFLDELPSRDRLHASTLEYTIYTNFVDYSLTFDDEHLQERYAEWHRRW